MKHAYVMDILKKDNYHYHQNNNNQQQNCNKDQEQYIHFNENENNQYQYQSLYNLYIKVNKVLYYTNVLEEQQK